MFHEKNLSYLSLVFPAIALWLIYSSEIAMLWLFANVAIWAVLAVSLFSTAEEKIPKSKWSYKFLYVWPKSLRYASKASAPERINVCDVPRDTLEALVFYSVNGIVHICLFIWLIVATVFKLTGFVFLNLGFLFIGEWTPYGSMEMKEYKKWPRVYGIRVLPMWVFLSLFFLSVLWIIIPEMFTAAVENASQISGSNWLLMLVIGLTMTSMAVGPEYFNSGHWKGTKGAVRDIVCSFKEKYCLIKEVE